MAQHYNTQIEEYAYQVQKYNGLSLEYGQRSIRLSIMRLLVLIGVIAGLYAVIGNALYIVIAWILSGIILFVYVVIKHQRTDKLKKKAEVLRDINQNEIDCLKGEPALYHHGALYTDQRHYYTDDLDIIGAHSLFGMINRTKTFHGGRYLYQWLAKLDSVDSIHRRTVAVQELEEDLSWRQELARRLFELDYHDQDATEEIDNLLAQDVSFIDEPIAKILRLISPVIWLSIIGCFFWDANLAQMFAGWMAGINLLVSLYYAKKVNLVQSQISTALRSLDPINDSLDHIIKKTYSSSYINDDIDPLLLDDQSQDVASLVKLKKIIDMLDYRLNIMVGLVLNVLVLWDLRILSMLRQWQHQHQEVPERIFNLVGKMEALMSLSTWAYNNQQFSYATIEEGEFRMEAQDMHHPLLLAKESVSNSISINPKEFISIITGSNMAGKSTFLRTLGCNMVLAYAGTRVTGSQLTVNRLQLISYMRIKDNIDEGVSTFKAELDRVAQILEYLKKGEQTLLLVDEMLRGTNSVDKLAGSQAIVKRLIELRSHALVATHDIQLATMEEDYPEAIENYFFDISYSNDQLQFDYKIKNGICNTFNASYLLRELGLDVKDHERSLSTK